jgi:hypothetical protein
VLSIFNIYVKEALQSHICRACHLVEIFSFVFFGFALGGKSSLRGFFSVALPIGISYLTKPRTAFFIFVCRQKITFFRCTAENAGAIIVSVVDSREIRPFAIRELPKR